MSIYNEQFLKQNPLAVLGVLRDLNSQQVPLRISWSGGQFISKILAVSPDELVMDFGSQEYENQAVQRASQISVIAETQGAKVEFTLPQLKKGEYQRLPAFISTLPPSLWFIQRREYFRIGAPLHPLSLRGKDAGQQHSAFSPVRFVSRRHGWTVRNGKTRGTGRRHALLTR